MAFLPQIFIYARTSNRASWSVDVSKGVPVHGVYCQHGTAWHNRKHYTTRLTQLLFFPFYSFSVHIQWKKVVTVAQHTALLAVALFYIMLSTIDSPAPLKRHMIQVGIKLGIHPLTLRRRRPGTCLLFNKIVNYRKLNRRFAISIQCRCLNSVALLDPLRSVQFLLLFTCRRSVQFSSVQFSSV